jgi:hypothetical protein
MSYFLPLELVVTEPSTQVVRGEVGDGATEMLRVAPVDADPDPVVGVLLEPPSVTNITEIKFEPPGRALCPSLFK